MLDTSGEPILEFEAAYEEGYRSRGGVELPRAGLRVTRIGEERLAEAMRIGVVSEVGGRRQGEEGLPETGIIFVDRAWEAE